MRYINTERTLFYDDTPPIGLQYVGLIKYLTVTFSYNQKRICQP
nr:MAG TPA: hypothetical protein [Caudoviricetes sp.]